MSEQRLSPLTVAAVVIVTAFWTMVTGLPVAIVLGIVVEWWVGLAVFAGMLLVIGIAALCSVLRWRTTSYTVTPDRFILKSGILKRSTRTFARQRIRAIDLSAGPVHRILGLAAVHIGTAEQVGSDGSAVLTPVPRDDALRLQSELLPRGGDVAVIARFEASWLRYAPLSWVPLIIAVAVLGVVGQFAEGFGEIAWRFASDTAASVGWWLVIVVVLGVPLIIGAIGSIIIHTELWSNHVLERESGVLRVRRGLLTTRTVSLPEDRMRGVRIAEPLGVRLAGAGQLEALAIGLKNQTSSEGNSQVGQSNVLLPYAPRARVREAAGAVLEQDPGIVDPAELTGHPRSAFQRRLLRAGWMVLAWVVPTGVVCSIWLPGWWWAVLLGAVLVGVVGVVTAWDLWKNLGHRITPHHLVTRSGTLHRITDVLERDAIIGWNLKQSIFQRRRGLVTAVATTGAGSGACVVLDVGERDAVALADAAVPGLLTPFLQTAD